MPVPSLIFMLIYALVCGMGIPLLCHLAICTLTSLRILWGMWAGFVCASSRSGILHGGWPSGTVEMATAISALVLLCKMRCMFFFTVKACLSQGLKALSVNPYFCGWSTVEPVDIVVENNRFNRTSSEARKFWRALRRIIRSSFSFLPVLLWRHFTSCMPCLVRLSLISFLNSTTD